MGLSLCSFSLRFRRHRLVPCVLPFRSSAVRLQPRSPLNRCMRAHNTHRGRPERLCPRISPATVYPRSNAPVCHASPQFRPCRRLTRLTVPKARPLGPMPSCAKARSRPMPLKMAACSLNRLLLRQPLRWRPLRSLSAARPQSPLVPDLGVATTPIVIPRRLGMALPTRASSFTPPTASILST